MFLQHGCPRALLSESPAAEVMQRPLWFVMEAERVLTEESLEKSCSWEAVRHVLEHTPASQYAETALYTYMRREYAALHPF